jgi:hypothetical protein
MTADPFGMNYDLLSDVLLKVSTVEAPEISVA